MKIEQVLIKEIAREPALRTEYRRKIEKILAEKAINWRFFKRIIFYHQLIPLTYLNLKDFYALIPRGIVNFLKNNTYSTLQRSHYFWREFLLITDAFQQSSVTPVPIKGVAFLADIYQDTFLRNMVDIDVLVQQENFLKAERVLLGLGYKKELLGLKEEYWRDEQYHIVFSKSNAGFTIIVELHWAMDYKRKKRHILPEIWQRLRDIQYGGRKIKVLSPEDSILSLALHLRRFGDILSLKNVYDGILIMRKYQANFDWDYCVAMSDKYAMRVTLFFLLAQMQFLSGYNIPKYVLKRLNISWLRKKVIRAFIAKNTFSIQDSTRSKYVFLQLHFLLYDSILEPVTFIINIPREQFAKFYGLKAYSDRAEFFYRWRIIYIFIKFFSEQ